MVSGCTPRAAPDGGPTVIGLCSMTLCTIMSIHNPGSAAHVIAESIRTQLGAEAVVLIIPGTRCAVVVAQSSDAAPRLADRVAEPHGEPAEAHAR
jgi:hypothetical protein